MLNEAESVGKEKGAGDIAIIKFLLFKMLDLT
ncbi:hypothetical protein [Alteribacillus sp. HJP-4]